MDLLDRLLGHDAWTTKLLLGLCTDMTDEQLDRDFYIGHRTLRATFNHIIHNTEVWSSLMAHEALAVSTDLSVPGLLMRLEVASARFRQVSRSVADKSSWDEKWLDYLENPPQELSYGSAIAHVITHSMHHRAQVLYMLRLSGVTNLPEGDVFSWEKAPHS